jgi:hypothetical protein
LRLSQWTLFCSTSQAIAWRLCLIPTPNKEIVVVQMGDNQEVIATRKRMVERIKQDPSNKVYVVKAESTSDTQLPIEGNIKQLAGEYEINIIGRSTIKEGNRVIFLGMWQDC